VDRKSEREVREGKITGEKIKAIAIEKKEKKTKKKGKRKRSTKKR